MAVTTPSPIYSHNNSSSTGNGLIIDIGDAAPRVPPVMIVLISATATVKIEGSHDAVNFFDYTAGGVTSSSSKNLVIGIRYWRTNITANTGTVTSVVGGVPNYQGHFTNMKNITIDTNVTASA